MTTTHISLRHGIADQTPGRTLLVEAGPGQGLVVVRRSRRDDVLCRVLARILDRHIAGGTAPESTRLLAVRAAQITAPRWRRRLSRRWDELAARTRCPQAPFDPRAPISPAQIDAAADEIAQVADLLRADRPVSARGVALASALLTTARSPAYRLGRGGDDLAAAVARAVAAM
jgi:hypothetical protein